MKINKLQLIPLFLFLFMLFATFSTLYIANNYESWFKDNSGYRSNKIDDYERPDVFEFTDNSYRVIKPQDNSIIFQDRVFEIGADDNNVSSLKFDFDDFPSIDGSTSNQNVIYKTVCQLTGFKCDEGEYGGEKWIYINLENSSVDYTELNEKVKISKTHGAYINLIDGKTDIIMVATQPSEQEQRYAADSNVELTLIPVARDAFIFMNNKKNPIENLTVTEIKQIYSGKIVNWKDVDGENEKIIPFVRQANSGSQEAMRTLVMKGSELIEMEEMMIPTMIDLVNRLDEEKWGLGYSFYYYVDSMVQSQNVRLLSVNGVIPSKDTIGSGEYDLGTYVYIAVRSDENSSNTLDLIEWLLSEKGQSLIEEVGYVSVKADVSF